MALLEIAKDIQPLSPTLKHLRWEVKDCDGIEKRSVERAEKVIRLQRQAQEPPQQVAKKARKRDARER